MHYWEILRQQTTQGQNQMLTNFPDKRIKVGYLKYKILGCRALISQLKTKIRIFVRIAWSQIGVNGLSAVLNVEEASCQVSGRSRYHHFLIFYNSISKYIVDIVFDRFPIVMAEEFVLENYGEGKDASWGTVDRISITGAKYFN